MPIPSIPIPSAFDTNTFDINTFDANMLQPISEQGNIFAQNQMSSPLLIDNAEEPVVSPRVFTLNSAQEPTEEDRKLEADNFNTLFLGNESGIKGLPDFAMD